MFLLLLSFLSMDVYLACFLFFCDLLVEDSSSFALSLIKAIPPYSSVWFLTRGNFVLGKEKISHLGIHRPVGTYSKSGEV